jgi:hypothetical protein
MTITIPIWLLVVLAVTVVWYAVGYAINSLITQHVKDRWMRKHKTGTVPDWYLPVCYVTAGPVGWCAWIYDIYDDWHRKRRRAKLDAADS